MSETTLTNYTFCLHYSPSTICTTHAWDGMETELPGFGPGASLCTTPQRSRSQSWSTIRLRPPPERLARWLRKDGDTAARSPSTSCVASIGSDRFRPPLLCARTKWNFVRRKDYSLAPLGEFWGFGAQPFRHLCSGIATNPRKCSSSDLLAQSSVRCLHSANHTDRPTRILS